ncbi:PAQR family membrane homeostasis protein TrhA [Marinifilum caeruleilacunae]|uniref:Hemolysin III family protein n=1 Tax=Marinifilum caeruleilacunae TaxID=2499076 RepID=A0ABX1WTT9_9BACT|nr:hemolysin III family protein [Marinifilum caeruleilacunae]NOU59514.1 hemolysin III family protein [Marinifilum caeruleilacunae]
MKWLLIITSKIKEDKKRFLANRESLHELWNWISHLAGVVFVIPAGIWLLFQTWETQSWQGVLAVLIFLLGFLLLYASSALYHYMIDHPKRILFRKMDHISIFVMIAGTYTPFLVIYLNNSMGQIYLTILWLLVVFGIVYKLFLLGKYKWISLLMYLFMGYILVFNYNVFSAVLPPLSLQWILIGGVFYTLGVIFYVWKRLAFNHFIWHLFVFGGSLSHFIAVYYAVI